MPAGHRATSELVEYATATTPATLPETALRAARDILLDTLGAMLGACRPEYSTARIVAAYARAEGGRPCASIVGEESRTGPSLAALVNGTLAYALDIESIHGPSITHAAAVVVPAALAAAETIGRSGAELLAAIVVGLDAADRISRAATPRGLYARGFHPSAVAGSPAAALAVANLLRLDTDAAARALGLAATQASGLMAWESDPTENARPFNCGIAARNGTTAALLAARGFGGPADALEGPGGLLAAFGDERSRAATLAEELGRTFAVCDTQIKRFACCAFLQPGVQAVLELSRAHSVEPSDVDEISLHFPRGGAAIIDGNPVRSHSAQYVLAVALTGGGVTFDDLAVDRRLREPVLAELSRRVRVIHSAELDGEFPERYTSQVELRLRDGRRLESRVTYPSGHPRAPLTAAQLGDKFSQLSAPIVGLETARAIIAQVAALDSGAPLDSLTALLRFPVRYAPPV